jgi:hypothetical protein
MPSEFLLIAIFVSPLLIGWLYVRYSSCFTAVAAFLAAGVTAAFLLSSLESSWAAESKALTHPLDFIVVLMFVGIWNIIGLMIWPVFSISSTSSNTRADPQQLHGSCPACGNTLAYNAALIGLDGVCPNCNASIIFPAPQKPDA